MNKVYLHSHKVPSGLLYYEEDASLFTDFFVKKHNDVLANPRVVVSDLKKCGKDISSFSVLQFLESYGFNSPEKDVIISFLKKERKL